MSNPTFSNTHAVLTGEGGRFHISVDLGYTVTSDADAGLALASLEEALHGVTAAHVMCPGDMLILDNRIALHGRTELAPRYDGLDRWLQRTLVVENFRASEPIREPGSHVYRPVAM